MEYHFGPMEGITTSNFRRVHARLFPGCDRYYTPFLSPTADHLLTARERREIAPERNREALFSRGAAAAWAGTWAGASLPKTDEAALPSRFGALVGRGMAPEAAARTIVRVALQKGRVKPCYAIGLSYKLLVFLDNILPCRMVRWLLYQLYGK